MKKLISLITLLFCLHQVRAQQYPPTNQSNINLVQRNRATESAFFMGLPKGPTPNFPSYVPDSVKCGALYVVNSTSTGHAKGIYAYNCDSSKFKMLLSEVALAGIGTKANHYADSLITDMLAGHHNFIKINTNALTIGAAEFHWVSPTYSSNIVDSTADGYNSVLMNVKWPFGVHSDSVVSVTVNRLKRYFQTGYSTTAQKDSTVAVETARATAAEALKVKYTDTAAMKGELVHKALAETIAGTKTFSAPVILPAQSGTPAAPASGTNIIYANAAGIVTLMGHNGFPLSLAKGHLTAAHKVEFENKDYTAADSADNPTRLNLKTWALSQGTIIYGDSIHDDRAALQAAINYCGTNKIPCYWPAGKFLLKNRLNTVSNLDLKMDGKIIRGWVGAEGELWSTFGQADYSTPLHDITIDGLNIGLVDTTMVGRAITLRCDNLILKNIHVRFYCPGPGIAVGGNNMRADNIWIYSATKNAGGGCRVYYGETGVLSNIHFETHDDGCQLVIGANDTMKMFNQSIKNFMYNGCTGISYGAKMVIVSIDENNYGTITNSGFANVKGYTTSTSVPALEMIDQSTDKAAISNISRTSNVMTATIPLTSRSRQFFHPGETIVIGGSSNPVYNQKATILSTPTTTTFTYSFSPRSGADTTWSGGGASAYRIDSSRVSHIQVSDFVGDLTGNTGGAAIFLSRVSDIDLKSAQLLNYSKIGFETLDSCKNIAVSGLHLAAPLTSGFAPVNINGGSTDIKIDQSFITAGSVDAISVGISSGASTGNRVTVNNSTIWASAGNYGFHVVNGTGNTIQGSTILSVAGSSTSKGVGINATNGINTHVFNNSLDGVNTQISNSGVGTVILNNTPMSIPGTVTLVAGTVAITVPGVTTTSSVSCWLFTRAGTTTTTQAWVVAPTANTLTFKAITSSGATQTSDTSVLGYKVN